MLRARLVRLLALGIVMGAAVPAAAQDPLALVDAQTQVARVTFRETDGRALDPAPLQLQVATRAPGLLKTLRARLPFGLGGDEGYFPLVPIEVARDAVRLQHYYVRNGFPRAETDYEVAFDSSANRARVTFVITHGPPLVIGDVAFGAGGGRPALEVLPPDLHADWALFTRRIALRAGDRLDEFGLVELQNQTLGWLRARGFAFADVGVERFVDDTGLRADIRLKLTPGPRARYGTVTVEGLDGLPERVVARELPFRSGDPFDARELTDGQREIFGLGLFQLALVDVTAGQPRDSTVDVSVRLRRGPTRVATGFGGYYSDGGLTARAQVTHRNFLGGARQASAGLEARTGWLSGLLGQAGRSVTGQPIRDYRASLSLRQPYVFNRRLSLTAQPSYRDRQDEIEASRTAEFATTLLYTRGALQTAAVTAAARYRALAAGQRLQLLDPTGGLGTDTLAASTAVLGADVTYGTLDSPLTPRRGFVVRPSVAAAVGDVDYARARAQGTWLVPFGRRSGLTLRASAGFLAANGPPRSNVNAPIDYLLLRDQLFFAGGTSDVRGWAAALLGPKTLSVTPDADGQIRGPGDVAYAGVGGRGKASASVQVNVPLPLGPQWGALAFVDGGAVFGASGVPTVTLLRGTGNATDAALADALDAEGGWRVGTGLGVQYLSPVGYISVALGIKLNPSVLDLRRPSDVLCGEDFSRRNAACTGGYVGARLVGAPFNVERDIRPFSTFFGAIPQGGRLAFHFSIGQTF